MSKQISTKDCVFCKPNGKIISGGYPVDRLLRDTTTYKEKNTILSGGSYIVPIGLSISELDLSSRERSISNHMIGGNSNKVGILPDAMVHRFYDNADIRKINNNIKKDNSKGGQIKTRKFKKHKDKNKKTRKII
jgi:hypothetical protein